MRIRNGKGENGREHMRREGNEMTGTEELKKEEEVRTRNGMGRKIGKYKTGRKWKA